eukprot:1033144-Amphidinium_carterae.1
MPLQHVNVEDKTDGATQHRNTILSIQPAVEDGDAALEVEAVELHAIATVEQQGLEAGATDSLGDELHQQRQERLKTERLP